jgi:hypothetical protein
MNELKELLRDLKTKGHLNSAGMFRIEDRWDDFCTYHRVTTVSALVNLSDFDVRSTPGLNDYTKYWITLFKDTLCRLEAGKLPFENHPKEFATMYAYLRRVRDAAETAQTGQTAQAALHDLQMAYRQMERDMARVKEDRAKIRQTLENERDARETEQATARARIAELEAQVETGKKRKRDEGIIFIE